VATLVPATDKEQDRAGAGRVRQQDQHRYHIADRQIHRRSRMEWVFDKRRKMSHIGESWISWPLYVTYLSPSRTRAETQDCENYWRWYVVTRQVALRLRRIAWKRSRGWRRKTENESHPSGNHGIIIIIFLPSVV